MVAQASWEARLRFFVSAAGKRGLFSPKGAPRVPHHFPIFLPIRLMRSSESAMSASMSSFARSAWSEMSYVLAATVPALASSRICDLLPEIGLVVVEVGAGRDDLHIDHILRPPGGFASLPDVMAGASVAEYLLHAFRFPELLLYLFHACIRTFSDVPVRFACLFAYLFPEPRSGFAELPACFPVFFFLHDRVF